MIIIGEIFSLLAALTLAYSTFSKKKSKMIWWQAINAIFYGLSNLFLGGYSAVVTNILTLSRNVLVVKEKLEKKIYNYYMYTYNNCWSILLIIEHG